MGKTVSVTYEVTCDTTAEFDDFLASLTGSPAWTVDASDATTKSVTFSGTYEV